MTPELDQLAHHQQIVLQQLELIGDTDYRQQYHSDLSPVGWHIGHCIYTETYWLRERWLGDHDYYAKLQNLYVPDRSEKTNRGDNLPGFQQLYEWAGSTQRQHRQLIQERFEQNRDHALMHNNFLLKFLSQHYAQHYETIQMILLQRKLSKSQRYTVQQVLQPKTTSSETITVTGGAYTIGGDTDTAVYDNELPAFQFRCDEFNISRQPVTNGEFLTFIEADGYQEPDYWSEDGWRWCREHNISHPEQWRLDDRGQWYGIEPDGPHDLASQVAVSGLCHHEALAFAQWANARLPHEYEWEIACQTDMLEGNGQVWEWCGNLFHPYDGFQAYPYEGYSVPYFNNDHYTLKGGSRHTREIIKRRTFRNYYQPDKRHIFAGLRLVYE